VGPSIEASCVTKLWTSVQAKGPIGIYQIDPSISYGMHDRLTCVLCLSDAVPWGSSLQLPVNYPNLPRSVVDTQGLLHRVTAYRVMLLEGRGVVAAKIGRDEALLTATNSTINHCQRK